MPTVVDSLERVARAAGAGDRAPALAHVACALARAGDPRAAALAREAATLARGARGFGRGRSLSCAAVALAATGARGEAEEALGLALAEAESELAPGRRQDRALDDVVHAIGAMARDAGTPALVGRALDVLERLEPRVRGAALGRAAPALAVLGEGGRACAIADRLLEGDLDAFWLDVVLEARDRAVGPRPLPKHARERLLELVRARPDDAVPGSTPIVVGAALRGEDDPWGVADALATRLAGGGHAFAALAVRLGGLHALARGANEHVDLLERVLDEALAHASGGGDWGLEPAAQVALRVPDLAYGEAAGALLARLLAAATGAVHGAADVHVAIGAAGARLSPRESSRAVLEELARATIERLRRELDGPAPALVYYEALATALDGLAEAAGSLVPAATEVARLGLARGPALRTSLLACQCLLACARRAARHGAAGAHALFDEALADAQPSEAVHVAKAAFDAARGLAPELRDHVAATVAARGVPGALRDDLLASGEALAGG